MFTKCYFDDLFQICDYEGDRAKGFDLVAAVAEPTEGLFVVQELLHRAFHRGRSGR